MLRTIMLSTTALLLTAVAAVAGPPGGTSGTWDEKTPGIYTNTNNSDLRFDTNTGRKAVPGKAAAAQAANPTDADSDNSVISRPVSTLVDPGRTLD